MLQDSPICRKILIHFGVQLFATIMNGQINYRANVFATEATEKMTESPQSGKGRHSACSFCKRVGHAIIACFAFNAMPVDEKRAFIIENRLCFKCLNVGHISKNCGTTPTCDRCQRRHLTCLHYDNDRANSVRKDEEATEETTENCSQPYTNVKSTMSFTVLSGGSTATSTVVPVWVSSLSQPQTEVLVYALLDTQSDSTFVTQETSDRLHADTQPVRLKLTTMTARDSVITCQRVTGLRVRGFASDASSLLPPVYTRDFIPFEEAHIPTNETAKQWEHLADIVDEITALQDCAVGLLIGYNCSQALAPRRIITGKDREPYAQTTDLGWSIVG